MKPRPVWPERIMQSHDPLLNTGDRSASRNLNTPQGEGKKQIGENKNIGLIEFKI